MKVSDIMIGDFVYNPQQELCKICEIQGIGIPYVTTDNYAHDDGTFYQYAVSEIEPIPLTAEILEKNGFKRCNQEFALKTWTNDTVDFILVEVMEEEHTWRVENTLASLCHVHEFQHMLRLCGIDKEVIV